MSNLVPGVLLHHFAIAVLLALPVVPGGARLVPASRAPTHARARFRGPRRATSGAHSRCGRRAGGRDGGAPRIAPASAPGGGLHARRDCGERREHEPLPRVLRPALRCAARLHDGIRARLAARAHARGDADALAAAGRAAGARLLPGGRGRRRAVVDRLGGGAGPARRVAARESGRLHRLPRGRGAAAARRHRRHQWSQAAAGDPAGAGRAAGVQLLGARGAGWIPLAPRLGGAPQDAAGVPPLRRRVVHARLAARGLCLLARAARPRTRLRGQGVQRHAARGGQLVADRGLQHHRDARDDPPVVGAAGAAGLRRLSGSW